MHNNPTHDDVDEVMALLAVADVHAPKIYVEDMLRIYKKEETVKKIINNWEMPHYRAVLKEYK